MARLSALLNRLVALVVIAFVGSTSLTFAAGGSSVKPKPKPSPLPPAPEKDSEHYLVVPDVRRQAYVFAKGMLEDAGFAWRVEGEIEGFATNLVAVQTPASGTRVLDTGAPQIVLRLQRNPDYEERGLPENVSPFDGTAVVLASGERPTKLAAPDSSAVREAPNTKPKKTRPAATKKQSIAAKLTTAKPEAKPTRELAFVEPGAPAEPQNEMALTARARMIARRMASEQSPSRKLVKWWLYQHAWIVTGAKFGWHDGDRALRILIKVDEDLYKRWGFGLKSAAVARDALSYVESRTQDA